MKCEVLMGPISDNDLLYDVGDILDLSADDAELFERLTYVKILPVVAVPTVVDPVVVAPVAPVAPEPKAGK